MNILFSIQSYNFLKDKLIASGEFKDGQVEVKIFPDGERYQRILTEVNGQNVILIGGTINDADTLELYDLACAIEKYGANSLTLIIPYFGYSTMERAVKTGEIVTAKTRARLLSSIPITRGGNRLIMLDLHSEGIPHYFEGNIRPIHLYCKALIIEACTELYGKDFILACTDAGRAKWVESLANDMDINAAFVFKRRISGENTEITGINADVDNKAVIIYDDMIRTGGSLINAAKAYKDAGAKEITAITTHGLFSNQAIVKLKQSGLFKKVISTDTHPNVQAIKDDFLVVKSIDKMLLNYLLKGG